jgi:8-oxo-dGTP pyrophosphatase MutT (NUDIX family)
MSPFRPDLVDVWPFRVGAGGLELLLMRRAQGRPLAGLWQGVSGSVEEGERIAAAAFRELHEETGFDALELVVWPAYREAIEVIERDLLDPGREPWFRLRPDGTRHIG